jgi:hypothetical protein
MPVITVLGRANVLVGDPQNPQLFSDPELLTFLHGMASEESLLDDLAKDSEVDLESVIIGGGRIRFVYDSENNRLIATTAYDVTRPLTDAESRWLQEVTWMLWQNTIGTDSFLNHEAEVLSLYLAQMLREDYGPEVDVGEVFLDATPDGSQEDLSVVYAAEGTSEDEFVNDLRTAVAAGNSDAAVLLGQRYRYGLGVPEDATEAWRLFEQSSAAGNPRGQVLAGNCLEQGSGVAANPTEAVKYYQRAAEQGSGLGFLFLGNAFASGIAGEVSWAKAVENYQRGAELEEPACWLALADCYEQGQGVPQDSQKADECRQKAAELSGDLAHDCDDEDCDHNHDD